MILALLVPAARGDTVRELPLDRLLLFLSNIWAATEGLLRDEDDVGGVKEVPRLPDRGRSGGGDSIEPGMQNDAVRIRDLLALMCSRGNN